jgi:electron transfer flavoprotein beta subunit
MNIVVLVKSAVDEAELRADNAGRPVLKGAATKLSDFDRIGVEEALRQRDKHEGMITFVTLGGMESKKAIKEAMAMGGDKAILVLSDGLPAPDTLATAYCLAKAIKNRIGDFDLVVCSEGASDTYQAQVGAMLAEFMEVPFLAYARNLELEGGKIKCEQVFDGVTLLSEAALPAVVSMVNGSNQPRYPTLLQVMAAAKKPIEEIPLSSLQGNDYPETGMKVLDAVMQTADRKRVTFEGLPDEAARKLIHALKQEGVL